MKIEWASDFHRDGSRRSRPKASTMHGWLAKMRGTLLGDERLRSRGMREMKEAKAMREYERKRKYQRKNHTRNQRSARGFSFFGSGKKSAPRTAGGHSGSRPALRHHSTSNSHRSVGHSSRNISTPRGSSRGSKGVTQTPAGGARGSASRRGAARRGRR